MSSQTHRNKISFLFNRKGFVEILISTFFFSLIFLIISQIDFKKSVKLQLNVKTLNNNVFQLFYIDEKEGNPFNEYNSIKIETKGSNKFQLVSFVIPNDVLVKKLKIEVSSIPEMIEIKSIKMSGCFATHTWGPKDLTINESSISFKRDISRIYKMIHKTTENVFFTQIWSLILAILFFFAVHYTFFFQVRFENGNLINIFTTISFIVLISLPIIIKSPILNFNISNENNEKRALAQKPDFNIINLLEFPKDYEKYFNDNFGFRQLLVKWNNTFKTNICKISPVKSKVILGKEGWLFYAGDHVIEDFNCTIPFSEEELNKIKMIQEEREQWLKKQGILYYIVIPPNKHTIYSEYLPNTINRVGEMSRLDQVISYLKKYSNLKIIDLRSELFKEKEHYLLYYKTDTHWNDFGAFFAYRTVINEIKDEYPQIKPLVLTDFYLKKQIANGGDLASMLSMSDSLKEEKYVLVSKKEIKAKDGSIGNYQDPSAPGMPTVIKVTNDKNLPKLVMFRDSFSTSLIPYFSENFCRSSYFWTSSFKPEVILKEKPNIVILETVERFIQNLLIDNPKLN